MAITRITKGVIKPNENYDTHNIVSTGIVTSVGLDVNGNADVSGSLSVGGVLTYEDVTSIDSIGIITARSGIDADDFISVGSNIHLGNAGVITATSFVGSGAALTGIDATAIKDSGGNVKIQAQASGAIHSGVSTFQDLDVDGHTNLDNVSIAGVTTFSDDVKAIFGAGGELEIYHSGTENFIDSPGGNLYIRSSNQAGGVENAFIARPNAQTELYYNNVKKLETTTSGVNVYGASTAGGVYFKTSGGTSIGHVYTNNSGQYFLQHANSHVILKSVQGSAVELYHNNTKRLETSSVGVSIPQDLDVDGHTNLDNVSIAGVSTFSGTTTINTSGNEKLILSGSSNPYIQFQEGTTNKAYLQWSSGGSYIQLGNNAESTVLRILSGETGLVYRVGTNNRTVWTSGNDGASSGLDADLLDGQEGSYYTNASNIASGTVPTARLGSGTANSSTFLAGDSTFKTVTGTTINSNADNRIITGSGTANTLNGEANLQFDGTNLGIGGSPDVSFHIKNAAPTIRLTDTDTNRFSQIYAVDGNFRFDADNNNAQSNTNISFRIDNSERLHIDSAGQVLPGADDAQNLGSSTKRWANIYAADMHYSNEGGKNSVDGTWGNYTIQEGESDLFLLNNRNGKKYKFVLQEVS